MRLSVYLKFEEYAWVKGVAEKQGDSMSMVVREIVKAKMRRNQT